MSERVRFATAFALFLERERKRANLSQTDLAEKLEVSETAVSEWSTATKPPSIEMLEGVIDFFGLSLPVALTLLQTAADEIANGHPGAVAMQKRLAKMAQPVPGAGQAVVRDQPPPRPTVPKRPRRRFRRN